MIFDKQISVHYVRTLLAAIAIYLLALTPGCTLNPVADSALDPETQTAGIFFSKGI